MATRPIFLVKESYPYYTEWNVDFVYNRGLSASQKRKNILSIHEKFKNTFPEMSVLEISSKSFQEEGILLSAFNLKKFVPSLGEKISVESIYHAGKVFENGNNYPDIMLKSSKDAKHDERLKTSGKILGFRYEGMDFPAEPTNLFYDYLYISALLENKNLADKLMEYDGFTDIEFTPKRSLNCQARAAAEFVSLQRMNLTEGLRDFDRFYEIMTGKMREQANAEARKNVKTEDNMEINTNDRIKHHTYGEGVITGISENIIFCRFDSVGEKKLSKEWAEKNCVISGE